MEGRTSGEMWDSGGIYLYALHAVNDRKGDRKGLSRIRMM